MGSYKVKKAIPRYKDMRIEDWTGEQLCLYFRDKFKEIFGFESKRPTGQLKIHINKRTIGELFRIEGRSVDIHPNQLFCDFIEWLLKYKKRTKTVFRVWLLSKDEVMSDFLEQRAEKIANEQFGTVADLKEAHETELEKTKKHFGF